MFEPGTASVALWLAMNPRHVHPRRIAVLLRRKVVKGFVLDELSEPVCAVLNVMPSHAVILTVVLILLFMFF